MATISYRRNLIAQIQDEHGVFLIHHDDKANHLWNSFKSRMGQTDKAIMEFDLPSLASVLDNVDFSSPTMPFSPSEIEKVIKDMPSNKAPGPDVFNGVFIKKCWLIIKEDILKLFYDFYHNRVDLAPINGSYIVCQKSVILYLPRTSDQFHFSIAVLK